MIKAALARIGSGLLLGIGFGIGVAAIWYGMSEWETSEFEETIFKSYGPEAKLSIKSHRPQRAEANSAFIGQIANEGADTWQAVEVVVELFEKDDRFIDKCSGYLDGSITPGETRNFKVSCLGCCDNPIPTYDHYTIKIVDATWIHTGSGL